MPHASRNARASPPNPADPYGREVEHMDGTPDDKHYNDPDDAYHDLHYCVFLKSVNPRRYGSPGAPSRRYTASEREPRSRIMAALSICEMRPSVRLSMPPISRSVSPS